MTNKTPFAIFLKIFILALAVSQFFILAEKARASTACASATVHVVARDQAGVVIPGITYEISETAINSDGKIRPGKFVASGKINPVLGEGKSAFSPVGLSYVVKMYDQNATYGAFYFYNELTVACGEEKTFTAVLSGLRLELRDAEGAVKKNIPFVISPQTYDANGGPVRQQGAVIAYLNSGVTGRNTIYLADASHTIVQAPASYVFSSAGYGGSEFILYNINLEDKKTKVLNYVFSDLMIKFRDKNTNNLPAGTMVEFFEQEIDASGRKAVGKFIKQLSVDRYGYVLFEYPAGVYWARIKKSGGDYHNFPDITINDLTRTIKVFDISDSATAELACAANSTLNVVARKAAGDYIAGIKLELYEKKVNANNVPAPGALIVSGVTDDLGHGTVTFRPDSSKSYILKLYDKNANVGAFWFYDDIKFNCGENKILVKNLSGLSLTARDLNGSLLKDYNFSLYLVKKDIDNNVLKIGDNLVADMKTNAYGQAVIYVSGGDPVQYQDIARYLISIKYNEMVFDKSDINVTAGADTRVNLAISGLSLTAIDATGNNFNQGTAVYIYEQSQDAKKNKILGKNVLRLAFDSRGRGAAALPAGTYALNLKDKNGREATIWDIKIAAESVNSQTITFSASAISSSSASWLADKLNGRILLQTESNGQAWYLNPRDKKRYYVPDGAAAYAIMKRSGWGIKNSDLNKIPVGILPAGGEADCDHDGLPDALEKAIGTQACNQDTDGDGYLDSTEVFHNYSPRCPGKIKIDEKLAVKLSGRILLQVEANGEAWYVSPIDKKRYYLKDGEAAFKIMKYLSLGITNADLNMIERAD